LVLLPASGFNLLKVNPGLVVWTLFTFLIVVLVLKKFALEERSSGIQGDIDKAEALRKEAEKSLKDYQDKLRGAIDEAHKIIEEAKRDAGVLRQKMMEDTNNEIKHTKEQAVREIELAKGKALNEMQHQIVEMSVLIAGEILEKQLKKEDYSSFVEKEISKLEKLKVK